MENSMTSMSQASPPKARISSEVDSDEESGWTSYFEDFMCKPFSSNDQSASFSSSSFGTPSLVSDAASLAPKKLAADRSSKQLKSSKKRKTKVVLVDDDLEDTASSPVNSPKVSYLDQQYMNQQVKNNMGIPEDKVNTASGVVHEGSECFLKKKGLCLVPVSMFANFLG